ncbi:MAG: hypothetical protein ABJB86_23575, partial [Bacteroidota bacterium]
MMQKIKAEENDHSQITMIAHNLTDVCGPRLTNSPGYKRAITWVTKTFKEWGLQNAGPEAWGEFGRGWSTERSYLAMNKPYYESMIAYPQAWTKGTDHPVIASLLLIKKLDSATIDKLGDSIKGKIIITQPYATTIASPFTVSAYRYADSELNKLPDADMLTRAQIEGFLPAIKKNYYTKLYLESRGAAGLLVSGGGRDGTVFSQGGPAYI